MNKNSRLQPRSQPRSNLALPVLLSFALGFIACQSLPVDHSPELESLQGHWKGVGPGGDCSVTIVGNSLKFHARSDFWYDTEFTIPSNAEHPQIYATILKDNSGTSRHVGTVVVARYKVEGENLTLGVIEDFEQPPKEPVTREWDWIMDIYELQKSAP